MHQDLCADDLQADNEKPFNLGVYTCHRPNITRSQFFSLTNTGVLRSELSCASIQRRFEFRFFFSHFKMSSPKYKIYKFLLFYCHFFSLQLFDKK